MLVRCWTAGTDTFGEKEEKSGMCVGWLWISGAENWLLKVATLSVKKLTKSTAIREEVGGGGGVTHRQNQGDVSADVCYHLMVQCELASRLYPKMNLRMVYIDSDFTHKYSSSCESCSQFYHIAHFSINTF